MKREMLYNYIVGKNHSTFIFCGIASTSGTLYMYIIGIITTNNIHILDLFH